MTIRTPMTAALGCICLLLAALLAFGTGCDDMQSARGAGQQDASAPDAASPAHTDHDAGQGSGGSGGDRDAGGDAAADAGSGGEQAQVDRSDVEPDTMPSIDDADYAQLISQLNKFGLELGKKVNEANALTEKNSVYSPLSASVALSMAMAGARGETANEMQSLLSSGLESDTYHAGINRLSRELASREVDTKDAAGTPRKIALNLADALYVDASLSLKSAFLDLLAREYDSGVHREDFVHAFEPARMRINAWVADQTHDKIQDLLPPSAITELTRLVLVNALYFYGSWLTPFQPEATSDGTFRTLAGTTVMVPTMHARLSLRYTTSADFAAIELPYVGGHLQMTVILPSEGQFEQVRSGASASWLETTVQSMSPKTVQLALPKFKMTVGSFGLTDSLKAMGMKQAFSDSADFTGISTDEPLMITGVVQKAFVSVDENGTEAAAATAVVVGATSVPTEIVELNIDRPFLFFIHDDSGVVLFEGHVVDPSKN